MDTATREFLTSLLAQTRDDSNGLPNLPVLSRYWDSYEKSVPLLFGQWTLVAPADNSRWYLQIADPNSVPFQYSTVPDDLLAVGSPSNSGVLEVKYKDIGIWMQQDIYCFSRGGSSSLSVISSSIRLR